MSFLEMLDVLNERLIEKGEEPIAFDSDCREGICGMCGHGHQRPPARARFGGTTVCQLHMRRFQDRRHHLPSSPGGRARFPIIRDLVVDRQAFRPTSSRPAATSPSTCGSAPDANAMPPCPRSWP